MTRTILSKADFLADRQGRTFSDVANDEACPFEQVLKFFSDEARQRRMEDSEIHHDRAPLAGVVRELESIPDVHEYLSGIHLRQSQRFRQAIGVLVRIVMEQRGWKKTGRKGSLGVRAAKAPQSPTHNTGGLSLWFIRAERYAPSRGTAYRTVGERRRELNSSAPTMSTTDSSQGRE